MKINNSIEIKIKMHTESQNHTSTQEKMREHTFILKNQKEEQAFEDMIEKHFLEEDMLNSLVEKSFNSHFEELFLEEKRLNSYIENLLEDDMHEDQDEILNSLIEEYLLKQDIQDSIIEEQALEAMLIFMMLSKALKKMTVIMVLIIAIIIMKMKSASI